MRNNTRKNKFCRTDVYARSGDRLLPGRIVLRNEDCLQTVDVSMVLLLSMVHTIQ